MIYFGVQELAQRNSFALFILPVGRFKHLHDDGIPDDIFRLGFTNALAHSYGGFGWLDGLSSTHASKEILPTGLRFWI